jgi:hypothetical protein
MVHHWERIILWLLVAACGAMLVAYNLGLYEAEDVDPILGSLVGLTLLAFGLAGVRSEFRRR